MEEKDREQNAAKGGNKPANQPELPEAWQRLYAELKKVFATEERDESKHP